MSEKLNIAPNEVVSARLMDEGAKTLKINRDDYRGKRIRVVRVVEYVGPADAVFHQLGVSHAAPAQRTTVRGAIITIVQGDVEVVDPEVPRG